MTDNTTIHELAEPRAKSGKIRFIHNGKEHTFYTCVNSMTKDRMSYFDNNPPTINNSLSWIKSVFNDIRAKSHVVECVGDF